MTTGIAERLPPIVATQVNDRPGITRWSAGQLTPSTSGSWYASRKIMPTPSRTEAWSSTGARKNPGLASPSTPTTPATTIAATAINQPDTDDIGPRDESAHHWPDNAGRGIGSVGGSIGPVGPGENVDDGAYTTTGRPGGPACRGRAVH